MRLKGLARNAATFSITSWVLLACSNMSTDSSRPSGADSDSASEFSPPPDGGALAVTDSHDEAGRHSDSGTLEPTAPTDASGPTVSDAAADDDTIRDTNTDTTLMPATDAGSTMTLDAGRAADAAGRPMDCVYAYVAGHGDIYVDYVDDALALRLRSELAPGSGEHLYDPHSVCIEVPHSTYAATIGFGGRPTGQQWEFLGVGAGDPFWYLPQVAQTDVPWFGLAAANIAANAIGGSSLTLDLTAVQAPDGGEFSAWVTDAFGVPTALYSTASGFSELEIEQGSHAHLNWGFSRAGYYAVILRVRALSSIEQLGESEATYRFFVLD